MSALAEAVARAGGTVTACDREPGAGARASRHWGPGPHRARPGPRGGGERPRRHRSGPGGSPGARAAPGRWGSRSSSGPAALGELGLGGEGGGSGRDPREDHHHGPSGHDPRGGGDGPHRLRRGRGPELGSHLRPGRDDLFVVEADEYDRSFHHLAPDVTVVTNVEADHLDIYGTEAGVREAFAATWRVCAPGAWSGPVPTTRGSALWPASNPGPWRCTATG
jgi:hypothetical protein